MQPRNGSIGAAVERKRRPSLDFASAQARGPGSMLTVVLLTDNNTRTIAEQALTSVELAICLAVLFAIYAMSSFLFGLIVASIAVHNMIIAIKLSFGLA